MKMLSLMLCVFGLMSCVSGISVEIENTFDNSSDETNQENKDNTDSLADFVKITTDGIYTMLASVDNKLGEGEEVTISTEYYICKYAVTNEQWSEFITSTNRRAPKYWVDGEVPSTREKHPVLWVSYLDCEAYCEWLESKYEGYDFRLPTQAEWEYAAVGDKRTTYPWGSNNDSNYSNGVLTSKFNFNAVVAADVLQNPDAMGTYNNPKSAHYGEQVRMGDLLSISQSGAVGGWVNHSNYTGFIYTDIFTEINDAGGNTCAVDDYPDGVSPFGCYNMSGNCWVWTSSIEVAQNGAEKGQEVNVVRGGSWYATSSSCRASFRGEGRKEGMAYATVGLRVVAEKIENF